MTPGDMTQDDFERKLYVVRHRAEAEIAASDMHEKGFFYVPSLSSRTIDLQGAAARAADLRVLHRAGRPAHQELAVHGAPALFHQHVSHLAARASLPHDLPQRRNQHRARQRQLDERARVRAAIGSVRRGSRQDFSRDPPRRQRHRFARQRRRAADAGGPRAAARHGHADPGSLGRRHHHAGRQEGLLRISRLPDGALGWTRRRRLHRRQVAGRHARPQRPAPRALPGHDQ